MRVFDAMPQDLRIRANGADVALVRSAAQGDDLESLDALPDPIELFVRAVNQQMFAVERSECRSSARVTERSVDAAAGTGTWRVHVQDAHPACLRVLGNLLSARDFAASVYGVPASSGAAPSAARPLDCARVGYPPALAKPPFGVEREEGLRVARDRLLAVEFASPPTDDVVDGLCDVMKLWCDLLTLGAFPADDMDPRESGALPEGPLLLDEYTVQIAFPEAFQADDKAFDSMINHLVCLTRLGVPIARVRVR